MLFARASRVSFQESGSSLRLARAARAVAARASTTGSEELGAALGGRARRRRRHAARGCLRHGVLEHEADGAVGLVDGAVHADELRVEVEEQRRLRVVGVEVGRVLADRGGDLGRQVRDGDEAQPQVGQLVAELRMALPHGGPFVAWAFTSTSLRKPEACAQRPTSSTTAVSVAGESDSVPGHFAVWPSEQP